MSTQARFRPLSNEVSGGIHKEYVIRLLDGKRSQNGRNFVIRAAFRFNARVHLRIIPILPALYGHRPSITLRFCDRRVTAMGLRFRTAK